VVKIQLGSVEGKHPFYSLSGSDNIILLTTEPAITDRAHGDPLVPALAQR